VLESDTIDVPVRTTDALLRRYSHLGKEPDELAVAESANPIGRFFGMLSNSSSNGAVPEEASQSLIELKGPIAGLIPKARPDQKAILEQLPARLDLGDAPTIEDVDQALQRVGSQSKMAGAKLATATKTHSRLEERVQEEILEIWPELNATYAPLAMALASERADEFVERVGGMSSYQSLCRARDRRKALSEEQMKLSRQEARLERLKQTCENVVLAANLPLIAPAEIVARYEQMLSMEEGGL
jgi:hypothetical protein